MKAQTQINIPEKFYITYYAKKHKKFITRKGQYSNPDDVFTVGKYYISKKGEPCFSLLGFRRRRLETGNLGNVY